MVIRRGLATFEKPTPWRWPECSVGRLRAPASMAGELLVRDWTAQGYLTAPGNPLLESRASDQFVTVTLCQIVPGRFGPRCSERLLLHVC